MVEIILANAIFILLVTALAGAYLYGQETTALAGNRARAALLAEEGLEATRNIRDAGYTHLNDGTFGLTVAGNQWNLSGSQDTSDIFTRQVNISSVDTMRKSVTASVTWQQNPQRIGLVSLVTRFTDWIAYSIGNWANPIQMASVDVSGATDGTKIQVLGNYAYMVRAGGTPDFLVIDISNPASPSTVGSLGITGTPTNIAVTGNYAYVSNTDNTEELQIIDVSTPSAPSIIGVYDAGGNANANGVYVSGTTVYLVRAGSADDEFLIINAVAPGLPTLVGSLNLGAQGNEVVVSGNYAYVASSDNSRELQVIDITTPALPTLAGSLNLSGNIDAVTIALTDTTVLLGQGSLLHTVNVAAPASPSLLGSVDTTGTLNDIASNLGNSNTYVFLATNDNNTEFQVVNISTPTLPLLLGSVNIATNANLYGIAYDALLDRAFGASASNGEEFIVFAPQ